MSIRNKDPIFGFGMIEESHNKLIHNDKHSITNKHYSESDEKNGEINSNESGNKRNVLIEEILKPTLLDEILNRYGYKFHMIRVIVLSVLLYYLSSYTTYHFSGYMIIIKREFKISNNNISLLGCLAFGFKILGCLFAEEMTKFLSRKILVIYSILILFFLNIFLAFVFQLWVYIVFLIFGCFIAGILDPLNISILCESLPIRFRGFFLCSTYTGFILSQLFQYILITNFSQGNSTDINIILYINSIIILLIFVLLLVFFRDSARHQLTQENYKEAYETIKDFKEKPLTLEEKKIIKSQSALGNKIIHETNLKIIFSSAYIRRTIIFIILSFSYNCMLDGFTDIINIILKDNIQNSNEEIISHKAMVIEIFGLITYISCGFITEITFIGRKLALIISSLLIIVVSIIFLLYPLAYFPILIILNIITSWPGSLLMAFVSESYPTKIRDISQSFINAVCNFGSFTGQLIFIQMYNIYKIKFTSTFAVVNSIICIIIVFFLKNETNGKPLDNLLESVQSCDDTDSENSSK